MVPEVLTSGFLFFSVIGSYGAYLYGHKVRRFRWSEYFALLALPVASSLGLIYFYGIKILYYFLLSMIVGFVLEYFLGLAYHKTLNHRLWVYKKFSLNGYTSWLALPLWGIFGIVFLLLSKSIGL